MFARRLARAEFPALAAALLHIETQSTAWANGVDKIMSAEAVIASDLNDTLEKIFMKYSCKG